MTSVRNDGPAVDPTREGAVANTGAPAGRLAVDDPFDVWFDSLSATPPPTAPGAARPGLVTCATTARVSEAAGQSDGVSPLLAPSYRPRFPSADLIAPAAGLFRRATLWGAERTDGAEGFRPRILVGPGCIALERSDQAKADRAAEREQARRAIDAALMATYQVGFLVDDEGRLVLGEGGRPVEVECEACANSPLLPGGGTRAGCPAHQLPGDPEPTREITEWSARSRARMTRRLCELDYAPFFADSTRVPAMLTLTYPGDWVTVAPNGKALKRHLQAFRSRFIRAWGEDMWAVWKLEFQRRGAPHVHFLMLPPHGKAGNVARARHDAALAEWKRAAAAGADPGPKPRFRKRELGDGLNFRQWVSLVWADIVAHPDPEERRKHEAAGTGVDYAEGLRATDPKRVAVYFTKHGTFGAKEYQNQVPEEWQAPGQGPGRFWGYWGLKRAVAAQEIEVPTYFEASRLLRRYAASQGVTREVKVWRTRGGVAVSKYPEIQGLAGLAYADPPQGRYRKARRPVRRFAQTSGFLSVNDGPAMASAVHRALTTPEPETWQDRRARLIAATGRTRR